MTAKSPKNPKNVRAGKRARRKGRKFEWEIIHRWRAIFADRELYRGQQGIKGGAAPGEDCDVAGTEFWTECKHEQQFNWRSAYRQALQKREEKGDTRPILIIGRDDKKPPGWKVGDKGTPDMVVMPLDNFDDLLRELELLREFATAMQVCQVCQTVLLLDYTPVPRCEGCYPDEDQENGWRDLLKKIVEWFT